jgi:hypothetical protein
MYTYVTYDWHVLRYTRTGRCSRVYLSVSMLPMRSMSWGFYFPYVLAYMYYCVKFVSSCVLCVLCVVDSFSAIGGPR